MAMTTSIREELEAREAATLSPFAALAKNSRGRRTPEPQDAMRTCFQRDRDRIIHSKAFRRLMHKTQVFLSPVGDHYRTRLTHSLEVMQLSRSIARGLNLNEDLAEAIALGHDLGHSPFGHSGESALSEALASYEPGARFIHSEQSLRVVTCLERRGDKVGLNLNEEVLDGIAKHSKHKGALAGYHDIPFTLEGQIVRYCDRLAYINHDIDDALRAGVIAAGDLPAEPITVLGDTGPRRIDALVHDLVEHSAQAGEIVQGERVGGAMAALRAFMFERVYLGPQATQEHAKIEGVVRALFSHYCAHPDEIPESIPTGDLARRVTDYLAGMTDRFCIHAFERLSVPVAFAP
ncbi:MAG: deoxyguanosinetriphosphate triphosphohydrolase [Candidatus Eremiobacter antarcticus]|nr:MAG: deoxyguanosinetriphosphate triphosphohydrolase [Candidatus Eremiobacter sp. RRmetagenome_bin22]